MKQSQWRPPFGVGAIVAATAVLALAACAEIPVPDPSGPTEDGVLAQVGPVTMRLPAPRDGRPGWQVQPTLRGVTNVNVTVCSDGVPCPSFSVVVGAALPDLFSAEDAWLPEGTLCPGTGTASTAEYVDTTHVIVGGKPAKLAVFDVTCVDEAGESVNAVQQRQWFVPGTPVGDVVFVDLWSVDELPVRLEGAQW